MQPTISLPPLFITLASVLPVPCVVAQEDTAAEQPKLQITLPEDQAKIAD